MTKKQLSKGGLFTAQREDDSLIIKTNTGDASRQIGFINDDRFYIDTNGEQLELDSDELNDLATFIKFLSNA